jgi:hypothetical protein
LRPCFQPPKSNEVAGKRRPRIADSVGCGGVQPAVLAAVERGGVRAEHSDPCLRRDLEKSNIPRIADELGRRRRDAL